MATDSYKEVKGGMREKKSKLSHLAIHPMKGGHMVAHHMEGEYGPEPVADAEHVFSKDQGEELLSHIAKHAKITVPTGEASESEPEEESEKVKHEPKESEEDEKGQD